MVGRTHIGSRSRRRPDESYIRDTMADEGDPFGTPIAIGHDTYIFPTPTNRVMSEHPVASTPLSSESMEAVYARITDAVFALDGEWRFIYLNEQAEDVLQRDEDDLLGEVIWEAFPEAVGSKFQHEYRRAMETQEPVTFEEPYPPLEAWFEVRAYPSATGLTVHFRDITERVNQKRQLAEREWALRRAYEIIADPDRSFRDQVDDLLNVVREAVGTDYAALSHVHGDNYVFEAVAAPDGAELEAGDTVPLEATNCERVVETERTLVLRDVETDAPELADRAGNAEWGISSYLGAPVSVDSEVYGTFCFYDLEARTEEFSDWEVTFVELLSNWVSHEIERQRYIDRLTALNELNGIVRQITDAVINQSTRGEIEEIACRSLADADSYLFAWIGETDPTTQSVELRTQAGIEDALEAATIHVDPDDEERSGPIGRALQTGELQTTRNARTDPTYEPWRDHAKEYGYRSSAAIPIVYDGTVYGVLNVYAERANAFEGEERSVIAHLGQILGHAIAAVDRKQGLMSDTVVELEFRVRNALAERGLSDAPEGTIVCNEFVSVDNDEFLIYGTASEEGLATIREIVDRESPWEEIIHLGERNAQTAFALRVSESRLASAVASLGGKIERAVIREGDFLGTVHLPQGVDIGLVLDAIRDTYPDTRVVSKRQVTRPTDSSQQVESTLANELTDRQLEVLRAAYFSGYFGWPRDASGEEVSEQLDLSSATFHEHLRAAEDKLFGTLLDGRFED